MKTFAPFLRIVTSLVLIVIQTAGSLAADKKTKAKPTPTPAEAKKPKPEPGQHYPTMRAAFAAKLPKFDAAWRSAVSDDGGPAQFLALAQDPENRKKDAVGFKPNELPPFGGGFDMDPTEFNPSAFDVYVKDAIKDYSKKHYDEKKPVEVFPGTRVAFSMTVAFNPPDKPDPQKKAVAVFANPRVKPLMPYTLVKSSEGWMLNQKTNRPMSIISFRYTVEVPDDTPVGEMQITLGGTAKGDKDGEFEVDNKYTLRVRKPEPVSRETLLAMWGGGIHALQQANDGNQKAEEAMDIPKLIGGLRERMQKIVARPENAQHGELLRTMFELRPVMTLIEDANARAIINAGRKAK